MALDNDVEGFGQGLRVQATAQFDGAANVVGGGPGMQAILQQKGFLEERDLVQLLRLRGWVASSGFERCAFGKRKCAAVQLAIGSDGKAAQNLKPRWDQEGWYAIGQKLLQVGALGMLPGAQDDVARK